MLGWVMPSLELVIIFVFAASLPVLFFVWLNWWLSSVKDEDPDKVVREQAEADRAHADHHGHGHDGHGHDHHHHAHA